MKHRHESNIVKNVFLNFVLNRETEPNASRVIIATKWVNSQAYVWANYEKFLQVL